MDSQDTNFPFDSTILIACVSLFLSAVMLCYLWYYEQPSFEELSKNSVSISTITATNWTRRGAAGGSSTALRFFEVIANSNDSKDETRYILSISPQGLIESLKNSNGICTLWFDPKQANEIFQIQIGDQVPLNYAQIYALKSAGWQSWWNISSSIFIISFSVILFYFVRFKMARRSKT